MYYTKTTLNRETFSLSLPPVTSPEYWAILFERQVSSDTRAKAPYDTDLWVMDSKLIAFSVHSMSTDG